MVDGLLYERHTSPEHGLCVRQKAALQRRGYTGETLEQRKQVLVLVLQHVPLDDQAAASAGQCTPACSGGRPQSQPGYRWRRTESAGSWPGTC